MSGIQIVLLTAIALITFYLLIRWKKRVLDVLLLCGMIVCAVIFVIWPEITTTIAHRLGVGRGADLVFYLSILIFWFVVLKLYMRIRNLEQIITQIVRDNALQNATSYPETQSE